MNEKIITAIELYKADRTRKSKDIIKIMKNNGGINLSKEEEKEIKKH